MKFLYCFILFFSNPCLSQNISRTIVDANTNAPVPFATIKVLHSAKGEIATAKGEFQLSIEPSDTVLVSSIGYQSKIITGREIGATIPLLPVQILLAPVTARQTIPVKTVILGNGKDFIHQILHCRFTSEGPKDDCWPWGSGGLKEEFAEKIELDSSKMYKLLKVYVPTRKNNTYGPLLLRIYAEDSISGMPGEELFLKYIAVDRNMIYKNKVLIDLGSENFYISGRKYFFISLGWPPGVSVLNDFTTLALFAFDISNTYARDLVSKTYNWFPFGMMNDNKPGTKKINSAYAVELEERIYK